MEVSSTAGGGRGGRKRGRGGGETRSSTLREKEGSISWRKWGRQGGDEEIGKEAEDDGFDNEGRRAVVDGGRGKKTNTMEGVTKHGQGQRPTEKCIPESNDTGRKEATTAQNGAQSRYIRPKTG